MIRAALTVACAFIATLAIGPIIIPWLKKLKFGQNVRFYGPMSHLKKQGVPTMGGIMITLVMAASSMAFAFSGGRWASMGAAVAFVVLCALIGFTDDYIKVVKHRSLGLKASQKTLLLLVVGAAYAWYLYRSVGPVIYIPFAGVTWDMGWWYIPFTVLVIYASTNSANLLDGVDGLLSGVTLVMAAALTLICYFMMGKAGVAQYDFGNMMVLSAAVTGACLGFLLFNHYPARVMMGDTGSFALGAAVTAVMLSTGMTLFLPILGIMYVVTSASDILQALSYKIRKKPLFRLAPLHHHLELGGMKEPKIVAVYMLITVVAAAAVFAAAM